MTMSEVGPWEGLTVADGRYQQLATIGAGGMAHVYRAHDTRLKTDVVIKAPRNALMDSPTQIGRFESEIEALIKLAHPHIVPVIDLGRHSGMPFAVMRYMSGGSLHDLAKLDAHGNAKPASVGTLKGWLPSIAKALDFVHTQHVIHRDVKPANILFDQHGNAFLSDFGIMKALNAAAPVAASGATREGLLVGTIEYMAPELFRNQVPDGRVDQYALAATVFEWLVGRPVYLGDSISAVMAQLLQEPIPSLAALAPHVPPQIAAAIEKGLAKDPSQRHANCIALVMAMSRASTTAAGAKVAGPAVQAPADTPTRPAARNQTVIVPVDADAAATLTGQTFGASVVVAEMVADPIANFSAGPTGSFNTQGFQPSQPAPVSQAASAKRRSGVPAAAWIGIVCAMLLLGVGGIWLAAGSSSVTSAITGAPADDLAQRMDDWNERAAAVESSMIFDSSKVLAKHQYTTAEELATELAAAAKAPKKDAPKSGDSLEGLSTELNDIASVQHTRETTLQREILQAKARGQQPSPLQEQEQRGLQEQKARLVTMTRNLRRMQQGAAGDGDVDAAGARELAVLREIETALAKSTRPELSADTVSRATELADITDNDALSFKAWQALLRVRNESATRKAIDQWQELSPEKKFPAAWSMLIGGSKSGLEAASTQFANSGELRRQLSIDSLLTLFEQNPGDYRGLLETAAPWCTTLEERLRLFRIQAPRMSNAWTEAIEGECRQGLLQNNVDQLTMIVVAGLHKSSYPLIINLLNAFPTTPLDQLTLPQFTAAMKSSPELGATLGEQLILQGTRAQREAALKIDHEQKDHPNDTALFDHLQNTPLNEPAMLLSVLIRGHDPRDILMAERLLSGTQDIDPKLVEYHQASAAVLANEKVRQALARLAARGGKSQRNWVIEQMLGAEAVKELRGAATNADQQMKDTESAMKVLDGKLVAIKGLGDKVLADKGLVIPISDFPALPRNIDPKTTDPEADNGQKLKQLVERLATAKSEADVVLATDIDGIAQYVGNAAELVKVVHRIEKAYDLTITQQLAGAKRGLVSQPKDNWHFRFMDSLYQPYQLDRLAYQKLAREVRAQQDLLKSILHPDAK